MGKSFLQCHDEYSNQVRGKIRTLKQTAAILEMKSVSNSGLVSLRNLKKNELVFQCGFERFRSFAGVEVPANWTDLVFNDFYRTIVKSNCVVARKVLRTDPHDRLKGTHFELQFPGNIPAVSRSGDQAYRLIELQSEPILLEGPSGEVSFSTIDMLIPKGLFFPDQYHHITPIIRNGMEELKNESQLVASGSAPYVANKLLSYFTLTQIDILELLLYGKSNSEIVAFYESIGRKVSLGTIEKHRKNIKFRVKKLLDNKNEVEFATILGRLGCL